MYDKFNSDNLAVFFFRTNMKLKEDRLGTLQYNIHARYKSNYPKI
jgi:hypothetical protein